MIVRVFRVRVRPDAVEAYGRLLREVAIPMVTTREGLVGLSVGGPDETSPREFVVITTWRDAEAMHAFTGLDRAPVVLGDEAELVESTSVEHFASILDWRLEDGPLDPLGRPVPSTTAALLARVEDGWAVARAAIGRIATRGLDRPTEAGWTYRAMALHIAAWHELTVGRLASWSATGERPPGVDVDAFNARVAEQAAATPDADVLTRLDGSYMAFLEAVRAIPDGRLGELEGWPVAVVAGNSYGHYAEHAAELGAT